MSNPIPKKHLLSYGILATPLAFAGVPLYIYVPDFYATQFGISLSALGIILMILRFIDAAQDPLIGYYSDQLAKRRPTIILLFSVILVICFALLFNPLSNATLLWFSVFVFLTSTAFSVLTININTIGGLWSKNKQQKTTIVGYREAFGLMGLIIAVTLPTLLQQSMTPIHTFHYMSAVLAGLMTIGLLGFWHWKNHNILPIPSTQVATKKPSQLPIGIIRFFQIYAVSMLASSIPAVLILFFIRDKLGLEHLTGLFLLTYFLSAAIAMAFWHRLSGKIGKHKTWLIAMIVAVISFIWASGLEAGNAWQYGIICLLSGASFGAELMLPASILADHIHTHKKERSASYYFGILAFLAKLSLAVSAAISFLLLDFYAFVPAGNNTEKSLHMLSLTYAVIPCLIKGFSIYLLWRHINEKNHLNNNRSINHA